MGMSQNKQTPGTATTDNCCDNTTTKCNNFTTSFTQQSSWFLLKFLFWLAPVSILGPIVINIWLYVMQPVCAKFQGLFQGTQFHGLKGSNETDLKFAQQTVIYLRVLFDICQFLQDRCSQSKNLYHKATLLQIMMFPFFGTTLSFMNLQLFYRTYLAEDKESLILDGYQRITTNAHITTFTNIILIIITTINNTKIQGEQTEGFNNKKWPICRPISEQNRSDQLLAIFLVTLISWMQIFFMNYKQIKGVHHRITLLKEYLRFAQAEMYFNGDNKTETLISNKMNFNQIFINGVQQGKSIFEIPKYQQQLQIDKKSLMESPEYAEYQKSDSKNKTDKKFIMDDNIHMQDEKLIEISRDDKNKEQTNVSKVMKHLAVSQSVIKDSDNKNSASSPDELAFLAASKAFGQEFIRRNNSPIERNTPLENLIAKIDQKTKNEIYKLYNNGKNLKMSEKDLLQTLRSYYPILIEELNISLENLNSFIKYIDPKQVCSYDKTITILKDNGKNEAPSEMTFKVEHEIEFTSDRKCMSVIVKDKNKHYLLTKGANSVIFAKQSDLDKNNNSDLTNKYSDAADLYSSSGLRTLAFGMRKITEEELNKWAEGQEKLLKSTDQDKMDQIAEYAKDIEKDLEVIAITAIEDRLQDKALSSPIDKKNNNKHNDVNVLLNDPSKKR